MKNLNIYITEKFKISKDINNDSIGTINDLINYSDEEIFYIEEFIDYYRDSYTTISDGVEEYLDELDINELNIKEKYYSTLPVFFYVYNSPSNDVKEVYLMSFYFIDENNLIYDKIPNGRDLKEFYLTPGKPLKNLRYKLEYYFSKDYNHYNRYIDKIYHLPTLKLKIDNNTIPILFYNGENKQWCRDIIKKRGSN